MYLLPFAVPRDRYDPPVPSTRSTEETSHHSLLKPTLISSSGFRKAKFYPFLEQSCLNPFPGPRMFPSLAHPGCDGTALLLLHPSQNVMPGAAHLLKPSDTPGMGTPRPPKKSLPTAFGDKRELGGAGRKSHPHRFVIVS